MSKDLIPKEANTALTKPGKVGRGMEEPTAREDLLIPRAKLLQAMSPEVVDGVEGCRPGVVINSLTKEILTDKFIPIFKFTEYLKFNPKDKNNPDFDLAYEPGALIWKFTDPHDPRVTECEFGKDGEKPKALKVMNFLSYFPGQSMPVVISFGKTSYKAGKMLISLAQFSGGDMFSRTYKLVSKQKETDGNKYFVFEVGLIGKANKEDYGQAEAWYSQFRSAPIEVDPIAEEATTTEAVQ